MKGSQVLVSVLQKTSPLLLFLFAIPAGAAAAETRRLGICAAGQPAAESFSESLTVELSRDDSVELVERGQIRAIRRELHSAALLGANGHQRRLKLGRQLDADFLAWLSVVDTGVDGGPAQSAKFLRLVVSDCIYGARLRIEYFPFETDDLPETCDKCAAVIRKTLAGFSRDFRCLVTVPHFLSRDLTRTHDSLQDSYSLLLQMAMLQIPGVAVLEVDEARSIRDELLLAGREIEAPAIPLFIQGEFETTGQAPDVEVRLIIQVLNGDTAANTVDERMPLEEAPDFLRSRVVGRVLPLAVESLPVPSREQQRRWIAERAELFSRLGSVEQAIALREAALLLEPHDAEQRLALLDECHRRYLTGDWETSLRAQLENEPKESVDQRVRDAHRGLWERRMQHVEYLLRNRQVNPREAGYLIASTTDYWLRPRQRSYRSFSQSAHLEDQPLAQAFFWRTVPLIAGLDYGVARGVVRRGFEEYYDHINLKDIDWEPAEQNSRWITATGKSLLKFRHADALNGEMDPSVLEQLYRLLTELAPRDAVPSTGLFSGVSFRECFSNPVHKFYKRLSDSGHPGAEIFGKYSLLGMAAFSGDPSHRDSAELPDADALIKDYRQLPQSRATSIGASAVEGLAMRLRGEITSEPRRPQAPSPIVDEGSPHRRHCVSFQPLARITADWFRLTNCSNRFDLAWSDSSVYVMTGDGKPETIYEAQASSQIVPGILECQWDGRLIWVATNREPRIIAFAPDGSQRAQFGLAEGLPPSNTYSLDDLYPPLRIHAIEAGRLLAVGRFGRFGRDARGWFAELVADPTGPRVNVFHKLTKLPRSGLKEPDDPEFIAPISALVEWPGSHGDSRRLLAVRAADRGLGYDRPPLVIALPTLETSLAGVPLQTPSRSGYRRDLSLRILENGQVLEAMSSGVASFSMTRGWSALAPRRVLLKTQTPSRHAHLLQYEGDVLYAGREWHRIVPSSLQIQPLTDGPLPSDLDFEHYAASACFGLVAWNQGEPLHRVHLNLSLTMPADGGCAPHGQR